MILSCFKSIEVIYMCQHKDFTSEKSSDSLNSNLYFGKHVCFLFAILDISLQVYLLNSFYSLKGASGESFYLYFSWFSKQFQLSYYMYSRTLPANWLKGAQVWEFRSVFYTNKLYLGRRLEDWKKICAYSAKSACAKTKFRKTIFTKPEIL